MLLLVLAVVAPQASRSTGSSTTSTVPPPRPLHHPRPSSHHAQRAPEEPVAGNYTVQVDWGAAPVATASTAATIEVDCCEPFLTRDPAAHVNGGGPFGSYTTAMQDLGAEFVRWAPWYVYPRVVVMELEPPDCTAATPATNWNSEHFDAVTADFMAAVCGPQAALGKCEHSVAIQIATSPSWVWNNGTDPKTLPENPWDYPSGDMGAYNKGSTLVDETCRPLAEYVSRVVSHYTAGGHNDSCNHWHPSGLHYNWSIVSFYNENEHRMGGPRYTRCWDQLRPLIEKISPGTTLEGPETVSSSNEVGAGNSGDYLDYFLDPKNHADKRAPELLSFHWGVNGGTPDQYNAAIAQVDTIVNGHVKPLVALRDKVAPKTEMVLNEYIFFVSDWCDPDDARRLFEAYGDLKSDPKQSQQLIATNRCPNWADSRANGSAVGVNRQTLGWSASAAHFAYGYARLALQGFKYVGLDDLACGPWPDNEPAVTGIDWQTGEPMARFFVVRQLVTALGAGRKRFLVANLTAGSSPAPLPKPGSAAAGYCGATVPGGDCNTTRLGSFATKGVAAPPTTLAACVAKTQDCAMANYVSFSLKNNDCSWYSACDMTKLLHFHGAGYETEAIHPQSPPEEDRNVFVLPFVLEEPHAPYAVGQRGLLAVNKVHVPSVLKLDATLRGAVATVLEGVGDSPGYTEPRTVVVGPDLGLFLGPYAVATVMAAM